MRIIDYNLNRTHKTLTIKYALTGDEIEEVDIQRKETISELMESMKRTYTTDQVIVATFKALDYPIEMMDYVFDRERSGKPAKFVEVRRAVMYQLRKHTEMSFPGIANLFGFTHASVIYNVNTFQDMLDINDNYAHQVDSEVERILYELKDRS